MKIAIIGAGISGLTLGNLIHQDSKTKIQFQIFEKKEKNHENFGGIQLSPNATHILNHIGFQKLSSNNFCLPHSIDFLDLLSGKKIFNMNLLMISSDKKPYICLKRSVLINFFLSQLPKDSVSFNKEVTNIKNLNGSKCVTFSDGTSHFSDLVVSADGVFSKIRETIFDKNKLLFSGSIAFRTDYIKSSEIHNFDKKNINVFMGSSCHSVVYPLNKEKEFNLVSIISNKNLKINPQDWIKNKNQFLELFKLKIKNWNNNLREIIQNKKISCWPIFKVKTIDNWVRDNLVLVGDAAHAIVPYHAQGAAQSIEDAYLLFMSLKKNNLVSSLQDFQKIRKKRILKIENRSNFNQFIFHISNDILKFFRKITLKHLLKNKLFLKIYFGNLFNYEP